MFVFRLITLLAMSSLFFLSACKERKDNSNHSSADVSNENSVADISTEVPIKEMQPEKVKKSIVGSLLDTYKEGTQVTSLQLDNKRKKKCSHKVTLESHISKVELKSIDIKGTYASNVIRTMFNGKIPLMNSCFSSYKNEILLGLTFIVNRIGNVQIVDLNASPNISHASKDCFKELIECIGFPKSVDDSMSIISMSVEVHNHTPHPTD